MLLLCLSFATIFTINRAYAVTNTLFTTQAQVYSAFDTLPNSSGRFWKQQFGLSDQGNMIYAYWFRNETVACDLNHDGKVSLNDLTIACQAFGSSVNSTNGKWNPSADINCDGIVNMKDISTIAKHYEQNTGLPSKLIYIDGCIHGDEYESATLLYNLAQFLTNSSSTRASNITNSVQFLIVPIVNYDKFGLSYQEGGTGNRTDYNEVNLNRNFPYDWTATYQKGDINYQGPSPLSENESQRIDNIFAKVQPNIYDNFHVGGADNTTYPGDNPNGTCLTAICDGESQTNLNAEANVWSNYTAVSTVYNMTNNYNQQNLNSAGTAVCDAEYYYHIPSTTIEIWDYGNSTNWPNYWNGHPNADNLNTTMLGEVECLVEGDKNSLTGQTATKMLKINPLTTASVYVDPSTMYVPVGTPFTMDIDIASVTNLAAWQTGLTWNTGDLNCTDATIYDPSSWNGSIGILEQVNNTYTGTMGYFFNAQAMEGDTNGNVFNGTTVIVTLTFMPLRTAKSSMLTLSDTALCDQFGSNIAFTKSNAKVIIS